MRHNTTFSWNRIDEIQIKIRDGGGRIVYKNSININDTEKIADMFLLLEKYGQDLENLYEEILKRRDNLKYYDFKPEEKPFFF